MERSEFGQRRVDSHHQNRTRDSEQEQENGCENSSLRLSDIEPINTNLQRASAENALPIRSSHSSPSARFKRQWNSFWLNDINIERDQSRRHLVMVSTMKQCITTMRESAIEPLTTYNERDLTTLYTDLLCHFYNTDQVDYNNLDHLEELIFYTLHNLKFNIFIGDRYWNSAISDVATIFSNRDSRSVERIERATNKTEIYDILTDLIDQCSSEDQTFENRHYSQVRQAIDNSISDILIPPHDPTEDSRTLSELREQSITSIKSIYDSLITDLSSASSPNIKKWQNSIMPLVHQRMLNLIKHPDLNEYRDLLYAFLNTDTEGADILGVKRSDLNEGAKKPETLALFRSSIS